MRTATVFSLYLLFFCFLTTGTFAETSSPPKHQTSAKSSNSKHTTSSKKSSRHSSGSAARHRTKGSKLRYTRHRANKGQGPTVEQIPQEFFAEGHKFTPEEKAQASEIGVLVQNGMWKEAFKTTTRATKEHPERWWLQAARAAAASNLNRPKDVIQAVDSAIQTNAGDANPLNLAQLYTLRANALSRLNRKSEAIDNFNRAIRLTKTDPYSRAGAAWLLATSNEPAIRNGASAVALATEAAKLSRWQNDTILDVLAAAYAESGDFVSARKWEEKAILLGSPNDVPFYQHRLLTYQTGKPWRESLN
jgi:tetratricopeptide (TPR) repeat protein